MIVWKLLNQRLKFVSGPIDVVKMKIHAVAEKISDYIDFKIINDIMSADALLKIWNYRFKAIYNYIYNYQNSDSMRLKYAFNISVDVKQ
jgi:hypothetical protein